MYGTHLGPRSPSSVSQIALFPIFLFSRLQVEISLLENHFPSKAVFIHPIAHMSQG